MPPTSFPPLDPASPTPPADPARPPIRVLIVDDHAVVRTGLRMFLSTAPDCLVVGVGGSAAEALVLAGRHRPDVVLLDIRLPDGSGIDVCRAIRAAVPEARVILLTYYASQELIIGAVLAGASGYLLKETPPERLLDGVRAAFRGGAPLDPSIAAELLAWVRLAADRDGHRRDPLSGLTPQERAILPLVAAGKTNPQIARELSLSPYTVKTHVSNLLRKLGATRRVDLAVQAARLQASERAAGGPLPLLPLGAAPPSAHRRPSSLAPEQA